MPAPDPQTLDAPILRVAGLVNRSPAVCAWARQAGLPEPRRVLSTLHLALDGPGLARFSARFGDLRFEVRPPTLDDLFLKLAPISRWKATPPGPRRG